MLEPMRGTAEQRARALIDAQLAAAGWLVQDRASMNLFAGPGVAVRESIMATGHGRVDYLLYVDKRAVGVIEAKPEGTTLSGVEWQSAMYAEGLPADVRLKALTVDSRLPFVFEASGSETHFTNGYDPAPRARRVFAVPTPGALARAIRDAEADPERPTWRATVHHLPPLDEEPLRPAQITAIQGIERSLAEQRFDRSLVQMATGAGKTFTAVTTTYRRLSRQMLDQVIPMQRVSYPAVTDKQVRSTVIPLPGLGEQRRIVDILESPLPPRRRYGISSVGCVASECTSRQRSDAISQH